MAGGNQVRVDIVVPVYIEEEALVEFHARLRQVIAPLSYGLRIYYVDDGSTDGTRKRIKGSSTER
jgi:glycosyltransferase involved in cell wall biosynthesis